MKNVRHRDGVCDSTRELVQSRRRRDQTVERALASAVRTDAKRECSTADVPGERGEERGEERVLLFPGSREPPDIRPRSPSRNKRFGKDRADGLSAVRSARLRPDEGCAPGRAA
jgi:hypothetical protein